MRLWSLHPQYLDPQGLVALWREGLLAKKVLEGGTRGYRHHPQLHRFQECTDAEAAINAYLHAVCDEADRRGYRFDRSKLAATRERAPRLSVTRGQLEYEWTHLLNKLRVRSPELFRKVKSAEPGRPHPLFRAVRGPIAKWEVVTPVSH